MQPLLSIIVPVYKSNPYFLTCINSILRQKNSHFELLLINDGSPDNIGEICQRIALKDKRVIVIEKENGGPNSARNVGLRKIKGKYITFIDSDDKIIGNSTFAENIKIMENDSRIDILHFPTYLYQHNKINKKNVKQQYLSNKKEIFLNWYTGKIIEGAFWGKIYKASLFKDYTLPEHIKFAEDNYCIVDLIEKVNLFFISNKGGYYYRYREDSEIHSLFTPSKAKDLFYAQFRIYKKLLCFSDVETEQLKYFLQVIQKSIDVHIAYKNNIDLSKEIFFLSHNTPKLHLLFNNKSLLKKKDKYKFLIIKLLGLNLFLKSYINVSMNYKSKKNGNP